MTNNHGVFTSLDDPQMRIGLRGLATPFDDAEKAELFAALRSARNADEAHAALVDHVFTPAIRHWWAWLKAHWALVDLRIAHVTACEQAHDNAGTAATLWQVLNDLRAAEAASAGISEAWARVNAVMSTNWNVALLFGYDDLLIDYGHLQQVVTDWLDAENVQEPSLA